MPTASGAATRRSSRKRTLPKSRSDVSTSSKRVRKTSHQTKVEPGKAKKVKLEHDEKRLRRFRSKPPQNFRAIYERATSQRFYVLGRSRSGTSWCPEESVELTGSTGNIYVVHVAQQPTCSCPHARNGHQCKHILYVLSRVLRARFDLVYQLALLPTELQEIFRNALSIEAGYGSSGKEGDRKCKAIEGDCPICFMPFGGGEDIVYCRATCGQNIHKECFEMWAATKRQSASDQVTCPMCRTPWQGDDDTIKKIRSAGPVGPEGYVNVANQLGISQERDESTYYKGPRRGERSHWPSWLDS